MSVRRRLRRADPATRQRVQLVAAGVGFSAALALVAGTLALVTDHRGAWIVLWCSFVPVPAALVAGGVPRVRRAASRWTTAATAFVALAFVVVLGQLAGVLVAGRLPDGDERDFVLPSFVAAAVAASAVGWARGGASAMAARWVLGVRRPAEAAGRTLTERASQGARLDDLLLQLAESLRDSLGARSVQVWTRPVTAFELAAAVPDRPAPPFECSPAEIRALAGATVVGDAWLGLWVPRLAGARVRRVVPAVHTGAVLGFVLVERDDDTPFGEHDDRALAGVGRRLGEVLHARRLDAALAATLDDLRASRARLVAAADAERRRIERNLHDGAQQHLVALAVSLRLARDLVRDDPDASVELLSELAVDVRDTIQQLRDLAHGIYPPLLMDAGLGDALHAAAQRAPQPVTTAVTVGRHATEIEAAVYFCCLEALQNAAKHAPEAAVEVAVWQDGDRLRFAVADDGPGFDRRTITVGHGFQNMADRLGAIGGHVTWDAAPGRGTRVVGEVPVGAPAGTVPVGAPAGTVPVGAPAGTVPPGAPAGTVPT